MKKEIAKKWVKALRSEKYNQGQDQLCLETDSGDLLCCLGVLAELYCVENGSDVWEQAQGYNKEDLTIHGHLVTLPDKVIDWAGMKTPD